MHRNTPFSPFFLQGILRFLSTPPMNTPIHFISPPPPPTFSRPPAAHSLRGVDPDDVQVAEVDALLVQQR